MKFLAACVLLLGLALPGCAQLTVDNPKDLDVPKAKAEVIYRTACRVVGDELRGGGAKEVEFPLTLVMGADEERYTANDEKHTYTIYLKKWNENLFASSTMMLAIHRLVPRERQQQMLLQILRRANGVAPVSVTGLRGK